MKVLKLTLLMILLTGGVAAQEVSNTTDAPDVAVLKIRWRRVERMNPRFYNSGGSVSPDAQNRALVNTARINENTSARASGGSPPPPVLLSVPSVTETPAVSTRPGFLYEFTIKNTGQKTIRHMVFEYSFTDPITQKTVSRRQYKSDMKVRPGTTANIVVRSSRPPAGIIDASKGGQDFYDQSPHQMMIESIKYADGTRWQRASK